MVCPDSNTDEGHMPSTENEKQSSVQLIKVSSLVAHNEQPFAHVRVHF